MPIDTFPLPDDVPLISDIAERTQLVQDYLTGITLQLNDALANHTEALAQSLRNIRNTLVRSISQRTTRQQKMLADATFPLYQQIIEGTNQASAQLGLAAQAAGMSGLPGPLAQQILIPPSGEPIYTDPGTAPRPPQFFPPAPQPPPLPPPGSVDIPGTIPDFPIPPAIPTDPLDRPLPELPPPPNAPGAPPGDYEPLSNGWQVALNCDDNDITIVQYDNGSMIPNLGRPPWKLISPELPSQEAAQLWIQVYSATGAIQRMCQPASAPPPSEAPPTTDIPTIPGTQIPFPLPPPSYFAEPERPKVEPLFRCPEPPWKEHWPHPGSAEWCEAAPKILETFVAIGNQLWDWLEKAWDVNNWIDAVDKFPTAGGATNPAGYALDAFREILIMGIQFVGPAIQTLRESFICFRKWIASIAPPGVHVGYIAIKLVRGLVEILHNAQAGTDAAAWLVLIIKFDIRALLNHLEAFEAWLWPTSLPGHTEAHRAWLRGYITDEHYTCILRAHHNWYEANSPFTWGESEKITTHEAIRLARRLASFAAHPEEGLRQGEAEQELEASGAAELERSFLRGLGWVDPAQTDAVRKSYWEIPGIADHLHFLRKRVDDKAIVDRFNLMEGFEETFWPKFGGDLITLGLRKDYAALHYAAHWNPPAPGQLAEMVFRLREGRADANLVTTEDDYRKAMGEQALGWFWRDRMLAIQHPAPSLTLNLRMLMNGLLNREQFVEALMDLGYHKNDAERIGQTYIFEARRMRASSSRGWTPQSIVNAYVQGKIDKVFAADRMAFLGYSTDEINAALERGPIDYQLLIRTKVKGRVIARAVNTIADAYKCGSITRVQFIEQLTTLGLDDGTAQAYAQQIDSSISVELCKQNIAAIHKAFMKGALTLEQSRDKLAAIGVPGQRIEQYAYSWEIQRQASSPIPTAAKLLQWVATGYLDGATAAIRLRNLGWADPDATIMLAEAQGRLTQREARMIAAQTRTAAGAQREAQRVMKEAEREKKRLQTNANRMVSVSRLIQWYTIGQLDEEQLREALNERGYLPEIIEGYVAEAKEKKTRRSRGANRQGVAEPNGEPGV